MGQLVLFLGLGRLIIFLAQKAPYFKSNRFLNDLISCDLCLGVWVYTALSLVLNYNLFYHDFPYMPIFSECMTGAVAAFVMWLLREGWNAKFREFRIGVE